jgi:hypothetical protein
MQKQIKRTIDTGKAKIEIEVTYYHEMANLDGDVFESKNIAKVVEAKLFIGGKLIEKSSESFIYAVDGEKGRFGDKFIPLVRVNEILAVISEMHTELSKEFAIKTPSEIFAQESVKLQNDRKSVDENYERQLKNGLCPKCGTYCYGDCGSN